MMIIKFLHKLQLIPVAVKLALTFALMISLCAISLGSLIGFYQAQSLEKQATHFSLLLAKQAAYSLENPLASHNQFAIKNIANSLLNADTIAGVTVYASDQSMIGQYGDINIKPVFPNQTIEYSPESHFFNRFIRRSLGDVKKTIRHTTPITQNGIIIGYLSLSLDHSALEIIRLTTLKTIIAITVSLLIIGFIIVFYISHRLLKPLDDLMNVSKAISQGNFNYKVAHNRRKDEVGMLMQAMNEMNKGLLQKDRVEAVFSRYVSAQVAQQVLKDLDNIETVALGGDHLMASVFFADIVGFTSLSERLDAQQISTLLNVYFSKITEAVSFCGGHVDKFIGDCAMVVFGVPTQTKHHAFDCVACAWMILQLINTLNEQREAAGEVTVEFRIGANSGMMLAGNMGSSERMEYTVVGDAVNLASRLSGAAEPGELVITEDVLVEQGLQGTVSIRMKDLIKIRGKRLPVNILSVTDILTPFKEQMLAQILVIVAGQKKTLLQKQQPASLES
jgi:adenylate cyclase